LTVLDLSVVQDRETVLPEEYRLKYFNDQMIRPIDVSNLSLLSEILLMLELKHSLILMLFEHIEI
jgi:hypothetical protein